MINEADYNTLRSWLVTYMQTYGVHKCDKDHAMPGRVKGTTWTWMFTMRRVLHNAQAAQTIAKLALYKMSSALGAGGLQICGLEGEESPLLTAVASEAQNEGLTINSFSVRMNRRAYGLLNWIEGTPNTSIPTMLVASTCNTGVGLKRCFDICTAQNIPIASAAFAIVNRVNKATMSALVAADKYLSPEGSSPGATPAISYLVDCDDLGITLHA